MKKKYFSLIFLSLITFATINAANDFISREWEYLEKIFIRNSIEKAQTAFYIPKVLACSGITLSYTTIASFIHFSEKNNKKLKYPATFFYGCFLAASILSIVSNYFCVKYINGFAKKHLRNYFAYYELLEFIKNWPHHKNYTPICFHESFDELYEIYKTDCYDPIVKEKVKDLLKNILQGIYNRFPHRYFKPKVKVVYRPLFPFLW
ncbi:MAG: hypothetical protein WDZ41_05550 [Candidatus Babeliales bacterium]